MPEVFQWWRTKRYCEAQILSVQIASSVHWRPKSREDYANSAGQVSAGRFTHSTYGAI